MFTLEKTLLTSLRKRSVPARSLTIFALLRRHCNFQEEKVRVISEGLQAPLFNVRANKRLVWTGYIPLIFLLLKIGRTLKVRPRKSILIFWIYEETLCLKNGVSVPKPYFNIKIWLIN